MRRVIVRPAGSADARGIADLLSDILSATDTSAIAGPVEAATIRGWMQSDGNAAVWHVAESEEGSLLGVQWAEPRSDLPRDMADIATFSALGRNRIGTGSALFSKTVPAARDLGYRWLHAAIRADNEGGLIYYRSRGFEPFDQLPDVPLADGRKVDRIRMRFDLA